MKFAPGVLEEVVRGLAEAKRLLDQVGVPAEDDEGVPLNAAQRIGLIANRMEQMGNEVRVMDGVVLRLAKDAIPDATDEARKLAVQAIAEEVVEELKMANGGGAPAPAPTSEETGVELVAEAESETEAEAPAPAKK